MTEKIKPIMITSSKQAKELLGWNIDDDFFKEKQFYLIPRDPEQDAEIKRSDDFYCLPMAIPFTGDTND